MIALVLILLVTNLVTAVLLRRRRRREPEPDDTTEVFPAPRPAGATGRDRRLITIEVLNPFELASNRAGRLGGVAGSLAPGLTRRLVEDQVVKTLRVELDRMSVHADVRLHAVRRVSRTERSRGRRSVIDAAVVDEAAPLDLDRRE